MRVETQRLIKMVLSASMAGLTSSMLSLQQAVQSDGSMKKGAVVVAVITGLITLGHNATSYLSTPPTEAQAPSPPPSA